MGAIGKFGRAEGKSTTRNADLSQKLSLDDMYEQYAGPHVLLEREHLEGKRRSGG